VNCEAIHSDMVLAKAGSFLCKASEPMSVVTIVCPGRYSTSTIRRGRGVVSGILGSSPYQ
jgi:hypothetical protein